MHLEGIGHRLRGLLIHVFPTPFNCVGILLSYRTYSQYII
jgi:hypothetical protein